MKYGIFRKMIVLPAVLLLGLGGCVSETREDVPPGVRPGKQTELTFRVQVPDQAIPGQTRATDADEVINSIDLLLFDNNGDYEDHKTVVVGAMTDNKLTFSIKLDAGTYNVVTIANFAAEIAALKASPGFTGLNKAGVLELLATSQTSAWNISTTKIPMYGETGTIAITPGMPAVSMALTRMLARIDVKVTAPTADFELETIYLCNYHMTGYIAPKWNTSTGAIITPAHTDPNIPTSATAVTGALSALMYTPGSQTYEGQIYTFEADKAVDGTTNDAGRIDAACLVIKGKYKAGKSYWYRVDFTKAATATEMADPDWDPSQVEYLPLLRNYRYIVDIEEAAGIGYDSPGDALAAYSVISNLKVRLMCYDEGEVGDIVFNGQYYLGIGATEIELSPGTTGGSVLALTNYPGGWVLDTDYGSGTGVTYEGSENGWLTPSQGTVTTANNLVKADIVLTPTANTSGVERVAYVHIKAGRLTHKVKVVQKSIWIRIYASDGVTEITSLAFNSKNSTIGIVPSQQDYIVKWYPADLAPTITKTTASGANAFTWQDASTNALTVLPAGGSFTYGIDPVGLTQLNVDSDPFYTKASTMTYAIDAGGGMTTSASIELKQTHYQLLVTGLSSGYGTMTKTAIVKANADWASAVVETPTILSANNIPSSAVANTTGVSYTYTFNGVTGEATFTFTSQTVGLFDDVVVTITGGIIAPFFARSNIVMVVDGSGNKILTFAETAADHAGKSVKFDDSSMAVTTPAIPANVQGLHFRWGGLVGLSSTCAAVASTAFTSNDVVFWPTEYEAAGKKPTTWTYSQSATGTAGMVPWGDDLTFPYSSSNGKAYDAFAAKYSTGYDADNGLGDICRYISDKGWVEDKWRMPTQNEHQILYDERVAPAAVDGVMYGTFGALSMTNAGPWGFTAIVNARMFGGGITSADGSDKGNLTNPGSGRVVLPGAAYRFMSNGAQSQPGYSGYYWSTTQSHTTHASHFVVQAGGAAPADNYSRTSGYSVRCIRD